MCNNDRPLDESTLKSFLHKPYCSFYYSWVPFEGKMLADKRNFNRSWRTIYCRGFTNLHSRVEYLFQGIWGMTDNGSNVLNAVVDIQLIHMPCIGHTLQLSIKKAFDLPAAQRVIGRCKKCIAHFNKSTKETYKLHENRSFLSCLSMN